MKTILISTLIFIVAMSALIAISDLLSFGLCLVLSLIIGIVYGAIVTQKIINFIME